MGLVLAMAAAIWVLGAVLKAPVRARLVTLAVLYVGVVLAHLVLPADAPLRLATGGAVQPWLVVGGLVALVALYRGLLARLRARSTPPEPALSPAQTGAFSPAELSRYARHIILREIGGAGQKRLKQARVLVVGAGGLGSPALLYLAASGVGTIGVIDDDMVEGSNLQRQVLHSDDRIGLPKVQSAQIALQGLNPFITVHPYQRRLTEENAAALIADYDLVLDGSDNFDTRYLVNRVCVALGKPLIAAAITQWEGQISLYDPAHGGPCYECVFPTRPAPGLAPSCAEAGVASPLPGVIGAMMASEALKHVTGAGETLRGRLMIHDALFAENRTITVKQRADCPVCAAKGGKA